MMNVDKNDLFHVHTYRCGHAENVPDEAYIEKAISLHAFGIWFTDHAPFPGDVFGNRMKYSELDEYVDTLSELKRKYAGRINVHVGLEIEYFPKFERDGYYEKLLSDKRIELLLLGQHMAETQDGSYTFSWDKEQLKKEEYIALGNATVQGIRSGYFGAVAHPDRIYRRKREWTEEMSDMADRIIISAQKMGIPLEQNESSKKQSFHYWKEFWEKAEHTKIIHGLDAHSVGELRTSNNKKEVYRVLSHEQRQHRRIIR
jgi:histidinol-phosphatase (PHP family)